MAGQNHHFRYAAPEPIRYAIDRYTNETDRLYGVFNKRLSDREYLVGPDYSIADIASYPWIVPWQQDQSLEDFPHLTRWFEAISEREAVAQAYALVAEVNPAAHVPATDEAKRA